MAFNEHHILKLPGVGPAIPVHVLLNHHNPKKQNKTLKIGKLI